MGKIKVMSKYRLVGKTLPVFTAYILILFLSVILGNFSFLISESIKMSGFAFSGVTSEMITKSAVSVTGIILVLVIVSPLRLGCERWFLLSAKGENVKLKELFYYFTPKGILKSVSAVTYSATRKTAAFLLFLFPSFCLSGVLYFSFREGEISLYISYALLAFSIFLFVAGLCFYFVYTARYFAYYSIIVSNKTINPRLAFEKSVEITEGAYLKICFFRLSFLPWFLLCALIFPSFYVWGYYKESRAMLSLYNDKLYT